MLNWMEYPDSVREMSRMLQEAALNEGTPTPPESPAQTPAGCQPCAATTQPPDLNGGTAIHQCQQKEKSSDPSAAGGGVEAGGVAGGGADVERPASTSGPVSLSQILDRPVYAAAAPLSSQHPTAPAPPQAPAPQPSSMPVATMGNGTSGQTGGHHHHHHHHHNHHQDGLPGGPGPGNGRGAPKPVYPEDYNYLKGLVPELKAEVRDRDLRIDVLEAEKMDMRRQLKKTTEEATRLRREVHKLKVSGTITPCVQVHSQLLSEIGVTLFLLVLCVS
ncbi:hypothetical protein E2C01_048782 [Portunus trituberculatus]|uniref:Uncharacterized protein n=1 Tax=Portunus trituberculatus TaxID=210409 RepID=A0A5B7GC05_PORTR|nr:hypothetical protein [Portunus trituberculatus]